MSPPSRNRSSMRTVPHDDTSATSPTRNRARSKSWTAMSRNEPPLFLMKLSGGMNVSREAERNCSIRPSSPASISSLARTEPGAKRRMNPSWSGMSVSRQSSTIRFVSAMSRAIGFSLQTALPARSAASMRVAWVLVDVTMTTASTAGSWIASSASSVVRPARPISPPRRAISGSGSATTTIRAVRIPARVWRWLKPIRPTPRKATPIRSRAVAWVVVIGSPWMVGVHGMVLDAFADPSCRARDARQLFGHARRDPLGRQAVAIQEERIGRRLTPGIADPDPNQTARRPFPENLGHQAAEAAEDRVLLDADDERNLASGGGDPLLVDRLHRRDMHDGRRDPSGFEEQGRLDAAGRLDASRDDEDVRPVAERDDPAWLEAIGVVEEVWPGIAREAEIDRS